MKRLPILLALAALSSCAVGPDYERPAVDAPPAWRDGQAGAATLADVEWWKLFSDPVLTDLVKHALASNFDARLAMERVAEVRARLGFVKADLYPRLDAGAAVGVARESTKVLPLPDRDHQVYEIYGALSWELDLFGRIRRATEAERAALLAAEEDRHAVAVAIVSDVSRVYISIRELDAKVEIARNTVASRRAYVDLARLRFQGGKTSELDYRQAEAELARTQSILADLERQLGNRENELNFLLGRNPVAIPRGRPLSELPVPPQVPTGLPSSLLERRPDIRVAEQELVSANARIGEAKALMYPRVVLTATGGYASNELNGFLTSPASFWTLIGGITAPIWNWGKNQSRVEETEARMRQAVIAYERSIRQAFRDVEDGLITYRKSGERVAADKVRVAAQQKALALSESRYRGGVSPYLEVLDAQRQLFGAELDLATSIREQLVAVVLLYRALGGGWEGPAKAPESAR